MRAAAAAATARTYTSGSSTHQASATVCLHRQNLYFMLIKIKIPSPFALRFTLISTSKSSNFKFQAPPPSSLQPDHVCNLPNVPGDGIVAT